MTTVAHEDVVIATILSGAQVDLTGSHGRPVTLGVQAPRVHFAGKFIEAHPAISL